MEIMIIFKSFCEYNNNLLYLIFKDIFIIYLMYAIKLEYLAGRYFFMRYFGPPCYSHAKVVYRYNLLMFFSPCCVSGPANFELSME